MIIDRFSLPKELVRYFDFTEGSGTVIYDSLRARTATLNIQTWAKDAPNGGMFSLERANLTGEGVVFSNSSEMMMGTNDHTVSFNFKNTNLHSGNKTLIYAGAVSTNVNGFWFYLHSSRYPIIIFNDNAVLGRITKSFTSFIFNNNEWYNVVIRFKRTSNLEIFVNGQNINDPFDISSRQGSCTFSSYRLFTVNNTITTFLTGNISQFAMWHRALSDSEITKVYEKLFLDEKIFLLNNNKIINYGN